MIIHFYALCYNEENVIPFFLNHYEEIVDEFFIYDDGSKDNSESLLKRSEKVNFFSTDQFRNSGSEMVNFGQFYNQAWKKSIGKADWIIICNLDEFFYHQHGLRNYLELCLEKGVSLIPTRGFDMVSLKMPNKSQSLIQQVKNGTRRYDFDKICAFNPNLILETNFLGGRHQALPQGTIVYPQKIEVKLLHYKYIGIVQFVKKTSIKKQRLKNVYNQSLFVILVVYLRKIITSKKVLQ